MRRQLGPQYEPKSESSHGCTRMLRAACRIGFHNSRAGVIGSRRGKRRGTRIVRRVATQFSNQRRQRPSLDELHRVEMDAAFTPDCVHRHDVCVMQLSRRSRLVLETLQLLGIKRGCKRQHFERDATSERKLNRFVDDPHAATPDLVQNLKVSERTGGEFGLQLRYRNCRP